MTRKSDLQRLHVTEHSQWWLCWSFQLAESHAWYKHQCEHPLRQPFKCTRHLSMLPPGIVLSVHSKLMDVHLFSFSLFLKSIDKLLTIIQYIHDIFILVKICFYFFLYFLLFFSRLSILICVRVCCLASAWLAALGRRFNEAEMSPVDSWRLSSANERAPHVLFPWFQLSVHGLALYN